MRSNASVVCVLMIIKDTMLCLWIQNGLVKKYILSTSDTNIYSKCCNNNKNSVLMLTSSERIKRDVKSCSRSMRKVSKISVKL